MRGSPGRGGGGAAGEDRSASSAIFVVARNGSTRLPGKVLLRVAGATLLEHLVARVRLATSTSRVVLCTTDLPEDDPLAHEASRCGIEVFRGPALDVPLRLLLAARTLDVDLVVLVEGDEQLVDARSVDGVLERARESGADFVRATGLPIGSWVCAIRRRALDLLCADRTTEGLDGWTTFFDEDPRVACDFVAAAPALAAFAETVRLSLDYPEDFELLVAIYERLYRDGAVFGLDEVLALLAREPELCALNSDCAAAYWERLERRREESVS